MTNDLAIRHSNRNREAPWIGVGTSGKWREVDEALHDCGLDFHVESYDTYCEVPVHHGIFTLGNTTHVTFTNQPTKVPGIMANVREDTGEILGAVTDRYSIVQNKDAFSLLQPFCNAGGKIIQGGMTQQGMCFMVVKMIDETILGDAFEFYVCAMNSFNAKFPLAVFMTPVRVICQNMFRKLMKKENVLRFKHGTNINERLLTASTAMNDVFEFALSFSTLTHTLSNKRFDPQEGLRILFPYPDKCTQSGASSAQVQSIIDRVDATREMFMDEYYDAIDNQKFKDSAYGFLNAYFDYASHRPEMRNTGVDWQQRKLSGIMPGTDINARLIKKLMK